MMEIMENVFWLFIAGCVAVGVMAMSYHLYCGLVAVIKGLVRWASHRWEKRSWGYALREAERIRRSRLTDWSAEDVNISMNNEKEENDGEQSKPPVHWRVP